MRKKLMPVVFGAVILAAVGVQGHYAFAGADEASAQDAHKATDVDKERAALAGKVIETMNGGEYTYVRLDRGFDKVWVATPLIKVKVGDQLVFAPGQAMPNFRSETLKRTFDIIIFSSGPITLPGSMGETAVNQKKAKSAQKIKVEKASGPNAYTVAELYQKSASLDKKEVSVRGKVVKVSKGIMHLNWVHIQDGTGDAEKGTDRIIATTTDDADVGDTVTATGTLAKDKDFGYGYRYDVIVEKASIKK